MQVISILSGRVAVMWPVRARGIVSVLRKYVSANSAGLWPHSS